MRTDREYGRESEMEREREKVRSRAREGNAKVQER